MRRYGIRSPVAEVAAQREADHQRWADDGGFTPDPAPQRPDAWSAAAAVFVARTGLPYRPVYSRRVGV